MEFIASYIEYIQYNHYMGFWEVKGKWREENHHLEELNQLVKLLKIFRKCTTEQCNAGLTGPVHSRNDSHCHIKDTEEFPALDPSYRGWWVEGLISVQLLCTGRYSHNPAEKEPRSFLKGSSRQRDKNWTFSGECYYKSSSEWACWREEDQIFSSSKKEAWKSYEILSVTMYSLFLLVIFLTRTDLSDLSLEKYMQPLLFC